MLWLAALKVGQRLALKAGDLDFASLCGRAAARAAEGIARRYWNGQFYAEQGTGGSGRVEPGALCAADQLWGQWAADRLDAEPMLPAGDLQRALQNLQRRNDAAPGFPFGPLSRLRADGVVPPNDPAARDSLLPASILAEAALYLRQQYTSAGLALLQRLDSTRNNALRSPWQSPLRFRADTGQTETPELASLTHAADWNILYTLAGFALDLDAGFLSLTPDPPGTWRRLSVPVFAPTFWAQLEFQPTARGGLIIFRMDRYVPLSAVPLSSLIRPGSAPTGSDSSVTTLVLRSVRVPGPPRSEGPPPLTAPAAYVSLNQNPLGARLRPAGPGNLLVTFDAPLVLAAGDRLEIDVH